MNDYATFEGRVEQIVWGRTIYTILRVPDSVVEALAGTRRVEGEIKDHPVNLALTRAPVVEGVFLWAGKSLLERVGIVPGEVIEVRLRAAPDDVVDVPDDVLAALRHGDATAAWQALTPDRQRGLLYQISTAKTQVTRAKRTNAMIVALARAT